MSMSKLIRAVVIVALSLNIVFVAAIALLGYNYLAARKELKSLHAPVIVEDPVDDILKTIQADDPEFIRLYDAYRFKTGTKSDYLLHYIMTHHDAIDFAPQANLYYSIDDEYHISIRRDNGNSETWEEHVIDDDMCIYCGYSNKGKE